MAERLIVLVVVLAISAGVGLVARWQDGRVRRRGFAPVEAAASSPRIIDVASGAFGAVVVLGTRACITCARTYAVLRDEASAAGGEVQIEHLLLEDRPDLVEALGVRTAPTVVLLDPAGRVVGRHNGGLDEAGARGAVATLIGVAR